MEKTKRRRINIFGMHLKDLISLGTILTALFLGWRSLDNRFESVDKRFESVDERFEKIDRRLDSINFRLDGMKVRLDKIESDVTQTSNLLHSYLTWRFLYLHDPARKNIEPRYDPHERTLDFFDKDSSKGK